MRLLTTLIATVSLSVLAAADSFDNKMASVQLLQDKRVQSDLKVTDAQRKAMNAHAEAFNKKAEAYRQELVKKSNNGKTKVNPDKLREVKMLTDLKAQVLGELSQAQIKRLREISLQAVGVTALGDDTVAQRIGLGASQKAQIRKIVEKGLTTANDLLRKAGETASKGIKNPPSDADKAEFQKRLRAEQAKIQPQLTQIRSETINAALRQLNATQKKAWDGLLGKQFTPQG